MINDEIIQKLARKHDLPEAQIKLVIQSFYDGLRYYLSNPLESKGGIIIHNFITFYINFKRLLTTIHNATYESKYIGTERNQEYLTFLNQLKINTYKYARQTNGKNKYERFVK
jgi:hypothetical protein